MGKPHRPKKTAVGVINRRMLQTVRAAKEDQQINKYIKQMMTPPDKVITIPDTTSPRKVNWWNWWKSERD